VHVSDVMSRYMVDNQPNSPPMLRWPRTPAWRRSKHPRRQRSEHRLNRGGNRRLNHVLYSIVFTQAHHHPEAKAYLARRMSEGKSRREAHHALKRDVVCAIWKLWQECMRARPQQGGKQLPSPIAHRSVAGA
jgi:hypothetical protein